MNKGLITFISAVCLIILLLQIISITQNVKIIKYLNQKELVSVFSEDSEVLQEQNFHAEYQDEAGKEMKLTKEAHLNSKIEGKMEKFESEIRLLRKELKLLNETYSSLLNDQKISLADITKTDIAVEQLRKDARTQYKNKEYVACHSSCMKILSIQQNDFEIRVLEIKSLYYKNPSDSSVYETLLSEIIFVSNNGMMDSELTYIKKNIMAEKGITNEE